MNRSLLFFAASVFFASNLTSVCCAQTDQADRNFDRENLVAWCIVPFDGKKRGPVERAEMLSQLGLKRVAYDWRKQHVAEFEMEILEYKKRGIEYFAFWDSHPDAFRLFQKHNLKPQIWKMFKSPSGQSQQEKVKAAAKELLPLVKQTHDLGCKLGLYNHGGWSGEPQNLVDVCRFLQEKHDAKHVGIVYNQHHAHDHINDFGEVLKLMRPYLLCLNLNGMSTGGDKADSKILPLGAGQHDVALLKSIRDSGYDGPIGIIGHTQDDVQQRLLDNLDGLQWMMGQVQGEQSDARPEYRTHKLTTQSQPIDLQNYSAEAVDVMVKSAMSHGDATRGLVQFASVKTACVSCHKIGNQGGDLGPSLTDIAKQRKPAQIIASVVWPNHEVKAEYKQHTILTDDGKTHRGYVIKRDADFVTLRDTANPKADPLVIDTDTIEGQKEGGSVMPANLIATMSQSQRDDLFRFLLSLGTDNAIPAADMDALLQHSAGHTHGPVVIKIDRGPLKPAQHPHWEAFVNRDRIYDFYAKQADYYASQITDSNRHPVTTFAEFPGLDGGNQGHWGNQNETVWANNDWNLTKLGTVQAGVLHGPKLNVPRAICVRLGDEGELSACFDSATMTYKAVWQGGFVKFSSVRHGFVRGLTVDGELLPQQIANLAQEKIAGKRTYLGMYLSGDRVLFSYRIGDTEYLDAPWVEDGVFNINSAKADSHPLKGLIEKTKTNWPEVIETPITFGDQNPYTIDTIGLPTENPWKALVYVAGVAPMADGSALISTMQGDVWIVSDIVYPSRTAKWKRFATGLHQPLGIRADADGIFVLCRDQLVRLHDRNGDNEADFYECFANDHVTSKGGHDFICGLERDSDGNFYTASGNQGVVRISKDGKQTDVLATGFRNPDGIGLLPDGTVTVPCSEGTWTPASMICAVRPGTGVSYHGFGGPKNDQPPQLPLVYLPRAIDNSAGGQTVINSDRWGPVEGRMIHTSFGTGSYHMVLTDEVDGQIQGALVPMPGEFDSGSHRAAFSPADGQLYVGGMQGWGSYTPQRGSFQRVRYTGQPQRTQFPIGWKAHQNGVAVTFSNPINSQVATNARKQFAQCWNYRYSSAYGSPEFSPSEPATKGHDVLRIESAHVLDDGRTLFLEIPELQSVNQLHLRLWTDAQSDHELFATVHKMHPDFKGFDGYQPRQKQLRRHPIFTDLKLVAQKIFNPHAKTVRDSREITIVTSGNLSFDTRRFTVKAGEKLAVTLQNDDVVPHNWAVVKPGSLRSIGTAANKMIADPDAVFRQYVPESPDVIAYSDIVSPKERYTIYFKAPKKPGIYPYLCTFPGHWLVMNGEMIVE